MLVQQFYKKFVIIGLTFFLFTWIPVSYHNCWMTIASFYKCFKEFCRNDTFLTCLIPKDQVDSQMKNYSWIHPFSGFANGNVFD